MHISIPVTEELADSLGGRYVTPLQRRPRPSIEAPDNGELYSVYLEGFILFKVRYRDLHFWDEQMHDIFGKELPAFPPKHYLAMTKSMAEDRRLMLEQYLQEVVTNPVLSRSDILFKCFKKLQLETFKIPSIKVILKVYLPDGRLVKVDSETSDTAERVLEAALYKLNLSRELMEHFSLFITHKDTNAVFSVMKRVAPFEIPFITIWNINNDSFQIDIRKWYMTPSTDAILMGCTAAVDLLFAQAVQELEMNWCKPTEQQTMELKRLIKTDDKVKFLELMQQVEHYNYQRLDPCLSDYLDATTMVTVSVGNDELYCSFQTSDNKSDILRLHISKVTRWHVMHYQSKKTSDQKEFKFGYLDDQVLKWITIRTNQAFLLSTWLKKMLSEQPVTKENLEILENKTSANTRKR